MINSYKAKANCDNSISSDMTCISTGKIDARNIQRSLIEKVKDSSYQSSSILEGLERIENIFTGVSSGTQEEHCSNESNSIDSYVDRTNEQLEKSLDYMKQIIKFLIGEEEKIALK